MIWIGRLGSPGLDIWRLLWGGLSIIMLLVYMIPYSQLCRYEPIRWRTKNFHDNDNDDDDDD